MVRSIKDWSLVNIFLVRYRDIIKGLLNKNICVVVDNKKRAHFIAKIDKTMKVEYFIGSCVRLFSYQCKQVCKGIWSGQELYDKVIYNCRRKKMTPFSLIRILEINIEGKMNNLYQAITFLGSKTRTISLCMITHDISKQITQFESWMV